MRLTVEASAERAAEAAAALVADALEQALAERGRAHIALAGGSTPRRTYELLGPRLDDWAAVELWFGDERAVPPDDPESNFGMVAETLLTGAAIPDENVHRIAGEREARAAADAYAAELRARVHSNSDGIPVLDVALLGLGEDGHTASLFPGDQALEQSGRLCVAVVAPKPPPVRVTLTLDVLRAARRAVLLAMGRAKAAAVRAVLDGPAPDTPASLLRSDVAELVVDTDAAPEDSEMRAGGDRAL